MCINIYIGLNGSFWVNVFDDNFDVINVDFGFVEDYFFYLEVNV